MKQIIITIGRYKRASLLTFHLIPKYLSLVFNYYQFQSSWIKHLCCSLVVFGRFSTCWMRYNIIGQTFYFSSWSISVSLLFVTSTEQLSLITPVNSLMDCQSIFGPQLYRLCHCLDHNCIVYMFYYFFIKEPQIRIPNLGHSHIFVSKLR